MVSQKVVTPVKTGVQKLCNQLKKLDSGFRRNDKKWCFSTFYEFISFEISKSPFRPITPITNNVLWTTDDPIDKKTQFKAVHSISLPG